MSVHLSRAKSITHFDDRYAEAKFYKFASLGRSFIGKYPFFEVTRISFLHIVGYVEVSSRVKNQLESPSCFDRTPTCDRQTQTGRETDRHRAMASTRASIASRWKKYLRRQRLVYYSDHPALSTARFRRAESSATAYAMSRRKQK